MLYVAISEATQASAFCLVHQVLSLAWGKALRNRSEDPVSRLWLAGGASVIGCSSLCTHSRISVTLTD
jgi:hypothetical protein